VGVHSSLQKWYCWNRSTLSLVAVCISYEKLERERERERDLCHWQEAIIYNKSDNKKEFLTFKRWKKIKHKKNSCWLFKKKMNRQSDPFQQLSILLLSSSSSSSHLLWLISSPILLF
jgi:hypothetical protein